MRLRLQGTWAPDVSPRSVAVLSQADPKVAGGSALRRTATRAVPNVQLVLKDLPKGVAGAQCRATHGRACSCVSRARLRRG
jgi:hypothetical protein